MNKESDNFTLEELHFLTDVPLRTIRYYIQNGLIDRPEGAKRGAFYTRRHLEQVLMIRKWKRAGLSLERIKELVTDEEGANQLPPVRQRQPGEISVKSHILVRPGIELVIDPTDANLSPEDMRALVQQVSDLVEQTVKGSE